MIYQEAHSAGYLDGDTLSLRVVRHHCTALKQIYICCKSNSHMIIECAKRVERAVLNVFLPS